MNLAQIETLARRVPQLASAQNLNISFLAGGITNQNYRVDADGASFVLRVAGEHTELLGIDRQREAHNHRLAANAGVAPAVVALLEPEEYLVTRFIAGEKIPLPQMRAPEKIRAVVKALRTLHAGAAFRGTFSPFETFDRYLALAREKDAPLPPNRAQIEGYARDCERALYRQTPLTPRPMHADLLNANFIDDGARVWILDWEYSGMGDIFFDLANFADHHHFNDDAEEFLLREYFGACRVREQARLKLMRIMSDLREAMWGVVQARVSTLDFDFIGYANEFFERMLRQATNERYPRWLSVAAGEMNF